MTTFEQLQNMNHGDQIIIQDPIYQTKVSYALIQIDEYRTLHFISKYGASFSIEDQKTIDAFKVELITSEHELWDEEFSLHCQKIASIIESANVFEK